MTRHHLVGLLPYYEQRQAFFAEGIWLRYGAMDKRMQSHEAYKALPAKVAQQVLKQLDEAWTSFFEGCKAYKENPSKFLGRPKPPKYKEKAKGRNILIYTKQAVGRKGLKHGRIHPSRLALKCKRSTRTLTKYVSCRVRVITCLRWSTNKRSNTLK